MIRGSPPRPAWGRVATALLILVFVALPAAARRTATTLRAVALEGDPIGAFTFESFGTPVINALGQVAFDTDLEVGGLAGPFVVSEGGGTLHIALAPNDAPFPAPQTGNFGPPAFNDTGAVVSMLDKGNESVQIEALASDLLGGVGCGQGPPPVDPGFCSEPVINDAWFATLVGDVHVPANSGLWRSQDGLIEQLVVGGTPVVGLPGTSVAGLGFPVMNAADEIAFAGSVDDGVSVDAAILVYRGSGPELEHRGGDPAPGIAGATFSSFPGLRINGSGALAFGAMLAIPSQPDTASVWSTASGMPELLALAGDPAPGTPPGVVFATLLPLDLQVLALNDRDQVLLAARLQGPGVISANDDAIHLGTPGDLNLVLREGDPAPGTGAGVTLLPLASWASQGRALNASGELVLDAGLAGPGVGAGNDLAIFAHLEGRLFLVLREGDDLEVAPGDTRTIQGLRLRRARGAVVDGIPTPFNDARQLAFTADFTDGSSGVFVATLGPLPVPGLPPAAVALLAMLLVGAGHAARRRRR
ncbi:MAG: DUF7453 family protein [Myxococcota bacterium]